MCEVAGEISAGGPEETGCDEGDRPFEGNRGEAGGEVIERSREIRLVVATDMPASCKDRIRSLILFPTFFVDSLSSLIEKNCIYEGVKILKGTHPTFTLSNSVSFASSL